MSLSQARERWLPLAGAALVFLAAWFVLGGRLHRPDEDELYGDETCWVAISIVHFGQVMLGEGPPPPGAELDPPQWQGRGEWATGVQRTAFGYPSPCFPKLVWGLALEVAGYRSASPLVFTAFAQHDPEQARKDRKALEPALPIARGIVLVLACLCTVLVASAARSSSPGVWGWLAAALAVALWLASPVVRTTAGDARTDYFMLVFELAALAFVLRAGGALAAASNPVARWFAALALGVLGGLCVSSKLNGAPLGLCIALWIVMAGWSQRAEHAGRWLSRSVISILLAGLTTCAVFWFFNPRLHAEPIAGVADILARWRELLAYSRDDWGPRSGTAVAHTPAESVALYATNAFGRDDAWRALAGLPALGAVFSVAGLGLLGWRALRTNDALERERAQIVLVFALVTLAATAAWLPIDWPRYYLTAAPALAIAQALALTSAARWIAQRVGTPRNT